MALGHTVRLMAPKFVIAYRKSGKNDGNDAAACRDSSRTAIFGVKCRVQPVHHTGTKAAMF